MNTKRVLYGEDEVTNRRLLEIKLKKLGIECDLAEDGLQALSKIEENTYDLVILDQFMPGINGDEIVKRAGSKLENVPLIAITSDDTEVESLRDVGFNEVFIKPLRGSRYIEIIKEYIKE